MFFFSENTEYKFDSCSVETAYLLIIKEDLESAKLIFKSIDSSRAKWGEVLIDIISGCIEKYPTYFDIRNFLEIDLDFLIKNEKIDYVEMLLGALDFLSEINQETYKYVARVMYENAFYKSCKKYLDKSKKIFYNDPELHFIYTKYYIKAKEYNLAKKHVEECLRILPSYYPALILKRELVVYLA